MDNKLDGLIKDLVSKKLADAKGKIFDTLQSKAVARVQSMKSDVASRLLAVEEENENV